MVLEITFYDVMTFQCMLGGWNRILACLSAIRCIPALATECSKWNEMELDDRCSRVTSRDANLIQSNLGFFPLCDNASLLSEVNTFK